MPAAIAVAGTRASPIALLVRHVRQAMQHAVAVGAFSAYRPATWTSLPVAICFMDRAY